MHQLIEKLEAERAQITATLNVLRHYVKDPGAERPVHWTQRPENAAKLRQTVQRMTNARVEKLRRAGKKR